MAMRPGVRWRAFAAGILAIAGVASLVATTRTPPSVAAAPAFETGFIPVPGVSLRDMGVTDVDGDGLLDVWSVNHSGRGSLLVRGPADQYRNVIAELGLAQDAAFPTFEVDVEPEPTPGLHVFWYRPQGLVVRATEATGTTATIRFYSRAEVRITGGMRAGHVQRDMRKGLFETVISLRAEADGSAFIRIPEGSAVPVRFQTKPSPGSRVVVGSPPREAGKRFTLWRRDRHAVAWADVARDHRPEVVYVRGGLRGTIGRLPIDLFEEMRAYRNGRFVERGERVDLGAGDCRADAVTWVDLTADGLLDLFVSCKQAPAHAMVRDRFGEFSDQARALGLNRQRAGPFVWLDADGDGDQDLLTTYRQDVVLMRNDRGSFARVPIVGRSLPSRILRFISADVDRDGDTDVLALAANRSLILRWERDGFVAARAGTLGLPEGLLTANWVDVDNDGLIDLHAIPGGLYRQTAPGSFARATAQPSLPEIGTAARATWFDADEDGRRDLLVAGRIPGKRDRWWSHLVHNRTTAGHWLQIDLIGSRSNGSAIGASVLVEAGPFSTRYRVGDAEGSHGSQGHHRIYAGLGAHDRVRRIVVTWADGTTTELRDLAGDRLITIDRRGRVGDGRKPGRTLD